MFFSLRRLPVNSLIRRHHQHFLRPDTAHQTDCIAKRTDQEDSTERSLRIARFRLGILQGVHFLRQQSNFVVGQMRLDQIGSIVAHPMN